MTSGSPGRPKRNLTAPWPIPPAQHPEHTQTLLRALREAQLDQLITMLHHDLPQTPHRTYTLLQHVFDQARGQEVSLLPHQGNLSDFHQFVAHAAAQNINGTRATANTVRTRIGALSSVYDALVRAGALSANPLSTLERPTKHRSHLRAPSRADIERLHRHAKHLRRQHQGNPNYTFLPAALALIDEHALHVTELLTLTWAHYDPHDRTLLRRYGRTRLSRRGHAALRSLHLQAGGSELWPEGAPGHTRIFPYDTEIMFRHALHVACQGAPIPHTSPKLLRLAALRDHDLSPEDAGFAPGYGEQALQQSRERLHPGKAEADRQVPNPLTEMSDELARTLAEQLRRQP
ncbi:hypothetical protein [Deinococcus navajonensis]|uniref:Core-binding (CB) domain-containing protein n=1 Tax=Deinococcus navajonensis TaxID=309884 RepID=A0ABV8XQ75_9DEIO